MIITVPDVMRHVRNYFPAEQVCTRWTLADGMLQPASHFYPGEWIAISEGPARGVWQLDENGAIPGAGSAEWTGCICRLSPPAGFLRLCAEITDWTEKHPYPTTVSEHLGDVSRSPNCADWTKVFASALAPYRRMYPERLVTPC